MFESATQRKQEDNNPWGFLRSLAVLCWFAMLACSFSSSAAAEDVTPNGIALGEEYTEYAKPASAPRSGPREIHGSSTILYYLPNRILDFLDIFRFDIGVGPSVGAVVRVTPYGQAGYRAINPASIRFGLRGRRSPVFVERTSEIGVGPGFQQSDSREVTPGEIGAGIDAVIVGAYAGISIDEFFDFVGGWFLLDFKDDDLS